MDTPSLEGSAAVIPTLTISMLSQPCGRGLCLSPACAAVVMANGWQRHEKCFICIPIVSRAGKVTLRSPSIACRAKNLPCPPKLPGLWRYKIFSNKKKLDHLPGGAIVLILMTTKDSFDHCRSHTFLIADSKPTSTVTTLLLPARLDVRLISLI